MIRTAIVGCGWVAGMQMEQGFALLPDLFDVVACCDPDATALADFGERHRIARRVASLDDVLAIPEVDAISICTPPALHFEMAMKALAAGKHVICEKPFTSSLARMDEIIAAERAASARAMPIFQYRFGPGFARIQRLVRSGLPGRLFMSSIETAWRRGADYYRVPWRGKFATELGGVLVTQAIHIHDLFLCLAGPIDRLASFKTTRVNPIEVEDCAVASLLMRDGSLASLSATLGSARPATRMRFCFENLTIERQCFDLDAPRPALEPWTVVPMNGALAAQIDAAMADAPPTRLFFAGQFAAFHQAIVTGGTFPVTLDEARRALELISALYHAAETGSVVQFPIGPAHERYCGWSRSATHAA